MTVQQEAKVLSDLNTQALLIRSVEQRLLDLFAQGKLSGTVHTCIGQEWSGVAVAAALQEGDLLFSNHRCHGTTSPGPTMLRASLQSSWGSRLACVVGGEVVSISAPRGFSAMASRGALPL